MARTEDAVAAAQPDPAPAPSDDPVAAVDPVSIADITVSGKPADAPVVDSEPDAVPYEEPESGSEIKLVAVPAPEAPSIPEPVPTPVVEREPEPEPVAPPEPVIWPALHLTGTLESRGGRQGAAFLNGEVVGVGERYLGVLVIEVVRDGVRLKKDGEERFLRVGAILD